MVKDGNSDVKVKNVDFLSFIKDLPDGKTMTDNIEACK